MIKDFDTLKKELKELATIVNAFKSEAVQLKIVELLFRDQGVSEEPDDPPPPPEGDKKPRKRKPPKQAKPQTDAAPSGSGKKKRSGSSRPGPKGMLEKLVAEGFFKKPKVLKDIIEHCRVNLVLNYKQGDFSGPLGRLTRDGVLKREKNESGQFQYTQS